MAENAGMMRLSRRAIRGLALFAAVAATCFSGWGQAIRVRSPRMGPRPQYVFSGSLTISVNTPTVNFTLVPGGTAHGSPAIDVTTTWTVFGLFPALSLNAWLSSPTAALSYEQRLPPGVPPPVIPSSAVLGQMTTGSPAGYTPFTQTTGAGVAGAGLSLLNNVAVPGFLNYSGSRTDVLNLEIDLSGVPTLPAGTYTGILTLQATIN